jgi:hypothetical protein
MLRFTVVVCAGLVAGCACKCPDAKHAAATCAKDSMPVGRWTGDWESYPVENPNYVREGTMDLIVAEGGKLQGTTVEEGNLDRGTLSGNAKPGGEFTADYNVTREGATHAYRMQGNFVCEAEGLSGMGSVAFGEGKKGNLKFKIKPAP